MTTLRTLRTCGPNRALPTGTITIIADSAGTQIVHTLDGCSPTTRIVDEWRVTEKPPPTDANKIPVGQLWCRVGDTEHRWHFYNELTTIVEPHQAAATNWPMVKHHQITARICANPSILPHGLR